MNIETDFQKRIRLGYLARPKYLTPTLYNHKTKTSSYPMAAAMGLENKLSHGDFLPNDKHVQFILCDVDYCKDWKKDNLPKLKEYWEKCLEENIYPIPPAKIKNEDCQYYENETYCPNF